MRDDESGTTDEAMFARLMKKLVGGGATEMSPSERKVIRRQSGAKSIVEVTEELLRQTKKD